MKTEFSEKEVQKLDKKNDRLLILVIVVILLVAALVFLSPYILFILAFAIKGV